MIPTTMCHRLCFCCLSILLVAAYFQESQAFVSHSKESTLTTIKHSNTITAAALAAPKWMSTTTSTSLFIGNNLFGGIFGGGDKNNKDNNNNNAGNTASPKTILDIPTTAIKVGPLNFFLQIFLVGEQNTPIKGTWVLNQNDKTTPQTLDMYHTDGTGMFSIALQEGYGMTVQRRGQAPSLQYQLQESVLLHALLDEVESIALADDIAVEKRLLQLKEDDALDKARASLPARKAKETPSRGSEASSSS